MNKLLRRLLVAMLLGVAVYAGFALYGGLARVAGDLARFRWSMFALACALAFTNYLLRFAKWEFYLARLGIGSVPKLDSLLTFLSGFVLTITPGKVGEVFKSLVLQETHGVRAERTAPIVLADRLTDVLGVVILIVAGSAGFSGGLVWAGLGTALVLVVLFVISSERAGRGLLGWFERGPGGSRRARLAPKMREAWTSLRKLVTPGALLVPTALSIAAWFMECLALWVILRGFGESTSVPLASFFYATATLAGALVPVPGGLGVTEATLLEQLQRLGGVGASSATTSMMLVRFATLWFAVLVGFLSLGWMKLRHPTLMQGDDVIPAPSAEAS